MHIDALVDSYLFRQVIQYAHIRTHVPALLRTPAFAAWMQTELNCRMAAKYGAHLHTDIHTAVNHTLHCSEPICVDDDEVGRCA